MSVEPVTITITTEDSDADAQVAIARREAAIDLGLGPTDIMCTHMSAVTSDVSSILDPSTNLPIRPTTYTFASTWAPKPVPAPPAKPEPVEWPSLTLSRGARWQGIIPDQNGKPIEANLISTGDKLVLIDSDEGKAILEALK